MVFFCVGFEGRNRKRYFNPPILCQFDTLFFIHDFLIIPISPLPLLGWDIMAKLGALLHWNPQFVWDINSKHSLWPFVTLYPKRLILNKSFGLVCGKARKSYYTYPVHITLKEPSYYSNKKQYPLKEEAKKGLQPIIAELLKLCQSSYNAPILPILKPNGEYHLVQDLRVFNEAVVPVHPFVADPYPLLSQIPGGTTWFMVTDLKVAFFSISLHM